MNAYVKPQLFISPLAKTWGTQLIKDLNVQQTACLSHFLDVNHCYDGHDATYIWANRYLNDHENIEYSDFCKSFKRNFPECMAG